MTADADPGAFPRRVLLAVAGLTPQVITETVWALARAEPPWVPTEIRVVTTTVGRERVRLLLLDPEDGALRALADDLDRPELATALDEAGVAVVAVGGVELDDIDTPAANLATADAILAAVRAVAADPEAALHVTIAGGRKTMGFLAGHALSLLGRAQDRLSHVLVDRVAENNPRFFFPPRRPRVLLATGDQQPFRPTPAMVRLAAIPFVRLRDGLPPGLVSGERSYAETVAAAQQALRPPRLVIDPGRGVADAGGLTLALKPLQLAFLLWFARRRKQLTNAHAPVRFDDADPREMIDAYAAVLGRPSEAVAAFAKRHGDGLPMNDGRGLDGERFNEWKARHNKLVGRVLGPAAAPYLIVAVGKRPRTRFRLAIEADAIEIVPTEE